MSAAPLAQTRTPFLGLRFFREEDAELFFGRDEQVDDLLSKLHESRFVTVIGSSGSGKSSLVSAGLIPALRAGYLGEAGSRWRIARATPGNAPIANLAASLEQDEVVLRRGPLGLVEAFEQTRLQAHATAAHNLLILADQFEELFRYLRNSSNDPKLAAAAEGEASDYVRLLLEATAQRDVPIYVILTMRSDFLGGCSRFRNLPERINTGLYLVPRAQRDQLKQAIAGPVRVAGANITSRLVERILNDIGDDQDQLPVLQHALLRTWNHRPSGEALDLKHYEAIGGLEGALDRHAEEIFAGFDHRQKYIAEEIFSRITDVDEAREIRRPATLEQLQDVTGASLEELQPVIDAFRAEGVSFLTRTGTLVDITHESLIRQWGRLRAWARKEYAYRQTYEQLATVASSDLARKLWLKGGQLARAEEWYRRARKEHWARLYRGNYVETEEFVRRSIQARDRNRLAVRIGAAAILLLVLAVSAILFLRWQETIRQRYLGIWQAAARQSLIDSGSHEDDDRGALLARQALLFYARTPTQPRLLIEKALHQALFSGVFSHPLRGHEAAVWSVASAPASSLLASAGEDATIRLWDPRWPAIPPVLLSGHRAAVYSVALSSDGKYLVSGSADGTVRVWYLDRTGRPSRVLWSGAAKILSVAFKRDNSQVAAGGSDNLVRVWDMLHPEVAPQVLAAHQGPIRAVAFTPNGRLISAGDDGTIRIWTIAQGGSSAVTLSGHEGTVRSIAVSPDGHRLASGGDDRTVRVWDLSGNPQAQVVFGHSVAIYAVAFAPDGRHLAAAGQDQAITIRDLGDPKAPPQVVLVSRNVIRSLAFLTNTRLAWIGDDPIVRVRDIQEPPVVEYSFEAPIAAMAFSPNGDRLVASDKSVYTRVQLVSQHEGKVLSMAVSGAIGGGLRVASASMDKTLQFCETCGNYLAKLSAQPVQSLLLSLAFAPDGERLASGGADGKIRFWRVARRSYERFLEPAEVLSGHQGAVHSVAFAPDGQRLASGGEDKTIRIWNVNSPSSTPVVLAGHHASVNSVMFSPDGNRLASGSSDGSIRLWDLAHPKAPPSVLYEFGSSAVNAVAFDRTGAILASGGDDGIIRVWDPRQPQASPLKWPGHQGPTSSIAFSPDGLALASGGLDKTVRLWPVWSAAADRLCQRAWRNLSMQEWRFYIGEGIPYESTCPDLPPGN